MTEHLVDLLDAAAAEAPDREFLRGPSALTFGEASAASHGVAAWLRGVGVSPGNRLLIAASNHADVIVASLGAARCGCTFAILHDAIRPAGFQDILRQVEPDCLVLDADTAGLRAYAANVPVLVSGADRQPDGASIRSAATVEARVETVRTEPVCLLFTSGSTGSARGVMVSHENIAFTVRTIQARLGYQPDDTVGLFLPLSFDYGLYQVFLALASRASLYVGEPGLVPLGLVSALADGRVTVLPGVPLLFSALAEMLERRPLPLPRLRALTNTGDRLPPGTLERLARLLPRARVFLMYGLTECKRVSILLPEEHARHPDSVGRPLDGTSVEIVDADGRPQPAGRSGELIVRGPHVTLGYWRAPHETAARFSGPQGRARTLRTGDFGRQDADGFLYFEGRADAQRKRRGFRISLLEIEGAAAEVSGVADAAAVQAPDSEELDLFVTSLDGDLSSEEVMRVLKERLEPYKVPDRIHVTPAMPATPTGKVDRRLLADAGRAP